MKVVLVNPFDPLPGEAIREGRYTAFARALAGAGHDVVWYSSDFSHTLKRPRDAQAVSAACAGAGFRVELLPTRPYASNVCLSRLGSHAALARETRRRLEAQQPFPDVVMVSSPPPGLAAAAAEAAARGGARVALDIQDLWPEAFALLWPPGLRWANRLAGWPMLRAIRRAQRAADLGIGVAEEYRRYFMANARRNTPSLTLHLGVDLAEFDRHAESPPALPPRAAALAGKRWILAGGMVGSALDWDFLFDLARRLAARGNDTHILIAGTGPLEAPLRQRVEADRVENVHVLGYQPYPAFCALAARADLGLNHFRRDSRVHFPNRVFDYFAADLPVINTIPGELAELLAEHDAGFTTQSADSEAAAEFIQRTLARRPPPEGRPAPRLRRGQWVARFTRPVIAMRLVEALENLAQLPRAPS